jgi:hypothetical protein
MNLLREKQKLMPYGNPMMDGGGGGGGGTQTTVNEVPEWARETAQRNLSKAEALTSDTPYQSYGSYAKQEGIDPNRVAGFTGLQNLSFQGAQNLQPSQAMRPAMGLAGAGAMGSLGAGQNYTNMATDPNAMQGFMSPYMQNVVNSQMQEANRNYDISGTQQQARATQAGAFGGSRGAIMAAENERNRNTALGGIQAQGLQSAFQNAQQAQQFGANLGLQGFGQAIQGAGQLANIGNQQFGQQKDALTLQNQFGGQQQANEQAKLGYNMQDYAASKQYPYQQLAFLSNIMRGTPMGGISTMYGAQPTMGQTLGGLGMGAYGLSQLARADGGIVSSYADGGSVDSAQNIKSIVDKLSDPQLEQAAKAAQMRGDVEQLEIIEQELAMRASERGGMAGAFNQLPQGQQEQMMAGGGIVAFAGDEDENEDGIGQLVGGMMPSEGNPEVYKQLTGYFPQLLRSVAGAKYTPMTDEKYNEAISKRRTMIEEGAGPSPYVDIKSKLDAMRGDNEKELSQGRGLAALQAASAVMQGRGLAQGLGRAGGAFAESYGKALQADSAQKRALMNMEMNAADAMRKERMGLNRDAMAAADQARKNHDAAQQFGIKKASALANVAGKFASATKPTRAAGAGGEKPLKLNEQLAASEIRHEKNPTPDTLAEVTALRRAVDRARTSDIGPTRAGQVESGLDVRLGEAITTAQQKLKFTPEYVKADSATKAKMLRDEAARVRANANRSASVNTNPPRQGQTDYSSLWGGGS